MYDLNGQIFRFDTWNRCPDLFEKRKPSYTPNAMAESLNRTEPTSCTINIRFARRQVYLAKNRFRRVSDVNAYEVEIFSRSADSTEAHIVTSSAPDNGKRSRKGGSRGRTSRAMLPHCGRQNVYRKSFRTRTGPIVFDVSRAHVLRSLDGTAIPAQAPRGRLPVRVGTRLGTRPVCAPFTQREVVNDRSIDRSIDTPPVSGKIARQSVAHSRSVQARSLERHAAAAAAAASGFTATNM